MDKGKTPFVSRDLERKEEITIRIKSIKAAKPRIIIGILGQEPGLGVTHLSISLANYAAKWLNARTALVEWEVRNSLAALSPKEGEEAFDIKGVTYFPSIPAKELGLIYSMDFEYIILDLGSDSQKAREELMRCNGKLIVGSLCPWRKARYYDYIKRLQEHTGISDMFTFLALFEDKIEIKRCCRTYKAQVQSIPFIANPFHIKKEETDFLHTLI